jgi:D-Tyr-tRNAtyr deacylase
MKKFVNDPAKFVPEMLEGIALANLDNVVADTRVQACLSDPKVSTQQLEGLVLGVVGDKLSGDARNGRRPSFASAAPPP